MTREGVWRDRAGVAGIINLYQGIAVGDARASVPGKKWRRKIWPLPYWTCDSVTGLNIFHNICTAPRVDKGIVDSTLTFLTSFVFTKIYSSLLHISKVINLSKLLQTLKDIIFHSKSNHVHSDGTNYATHNDVYSTCNDTAVVIFRHWLRASNYTIVQAITQNINSQHPISFVNRSLAERGIGRNGNFWQKLRRKRQMNLHYSNTPRRRRRLDARSSDKTIK